jgi:Asp/Glu/hydantoin racemase
LSHTLALIHTSPVLVPSFTALAQKHLDGAKLFHMVDESLIQQTIRAGQLEKATVRRLVHHVESAAGAGADVVLVTCSSIGPAVAVARGLFDLPVLRIDERMAEQAVTAGRRIGAIATLSTTLKPTVELLRETALRLGRDVTIESCLCEGAFEAVVRGDTTTHDQSVTTNLLQLARNVDVIVLAQASMARVAQSLPPDASRPPVLSSPELAMLQAREALDALDSPRSTKPQPAKPQGAAG